MFLLEGSRVVRTGKKEVAKMACSQCANAVGALEEADELGQALETWSDTAAQYWAGVGRQGRIPLTGGVATFRLKPVLGTTRMPMNCVILASGENAELRSWKAFGQWATIIRRASPKSPSPEHALYAARKIVAFIQGAAAPSKKVMDDLSSEERRSVVEESLALFFVSLEA